MDELDREEIDELLEDSTPEEVLEILEIVDDYQLDIEEAKEVKDLAEELGVDIDDAVEINEAM
jgi:hypothetical protein